MCILCKMIILVKIMNISITTFKILFSFVVHTHRLSNLIIKSQYRISNYCYHVTCQILPLIVYTITKSSYHFTTIFHFLPTPSFINQMPQTLLLQEWFLFYILNICEIRQTFHFVFELFHLARSPPLPISPYLSVRLSVRPSIYLHTYIYMII